MKKNLKKGFTIVELVIVIAVIGILTAVLVPTFSSLISRANVSADVVMLKNVNTQLALSEVDNGKAKTMAEAMAIAEENGILITNLKASEKSHTIVWDQQNNRFALIKGNEVIYSDKTLTTNKCKLWQVVDAVPALENQTTSLYLTSKFTGNTAVVKYGIDVGTNKGVKVVYQNSGSAQTVDVTTNYGDLEVNAPNDVVNHFGTISNVNVQAVANASYHEFGNVIGNIVIASGRVVVENNASANTIILDGSNAVVKVQEQANVVAVAVTDNGNIDNSQVDNQSTIKLESFVVDTTNSSLFSGGLGLQNIPYQIANENDFANLTSTSTDGKYFVLTNDIVLTSEKLAKHTGWYKSVAQGFVNATLNGNGYSIIGNTTEVFNPICVANNSTFKNITLKNITNAFINSATDVVFENMVVEGNAYLDGNEATFVIYAANSIAFRNCEVKSNLTGSGAKTGYNAVFVGYAYGNGVLNLEFTNCSFSGSIVCGKAAMFISNTPKNATQINYNITNFVNNGVVRSVYIASDYYFSMFNAVGAKTYLEKSYATVDGVSVSGLELVNVSFDGIGLAVNGPEDASLSIALNSDNKFVVTEAENSKVAYYKIAVCAYAQIAESQGMTGTQRVYAYETIQDENLGEYISNISLLKFVDSAWVEANPEAVESQVAGNTVYTLNGVSYFLITDETATTNGSVLNVNSVSVAAYDASNNLLASVGCNIKK